MVPVPFDQARAKAQAAILRPPSGKEWLRQGKGLWVQFVCVPPPIQLQEAVLGSRGLFTIQPAVH